MHSRGYQQGLSIIYKNKLIDCTYITGGGLFIFFARL